jgi:hypothetical protein
MSEDSKVEITNYGAGRVRHADTFGYFRDDKEIQHRLKYVGYGIAFVCLILSFFKPTQEPLPVQTNSSIPSPAFDGSENSSWSEIFYNRAQDPKNQRNKKSVGMALKLTGPKLISRSTKLVIPPGTEGHAILVSGATNGLSKAKVLEEILVNGETIIPAGAMIVGQGSSTEDRLFIHFSKVVLEDGTVSSIQAEACDDADKTVGLKGSQVSGHMMRVAAGAGLNFLAGASTALEDTTGLNGTVVTQPTMRNAILNGTAKSAIDESNEIASKYKNAPPALEVKAGTKLYLLFGDNGG